jgi:site-specific DNA-methyltransferase (adenine-specific)
LEAKRLRRALLEPGVPLTQSREASLPEKLAAKRAAWKRQPAILQTTHRLYLGDARFLQGIDPETRVHLVVTSPPYWDLKRYKADCNGAQLGHLHDRSQFVAELGRVWEHCLRLLVPGGRLCVVVGDVCRSRGEHGRHRVEPIHAEILLQCQQIGFDPLAPIIWQKIANVATEVRGNGANFLGKPYEPNAIIKNDVEYILMFRKPGGYRHPTQEQRDLSVIDKEDHRRWFQQVWSDVPGEVQRAHPAPFPLEVARRLIGMFSFVGDTVFDPFVGLGTTIISAMQMHRSSIGFEIEPEYVQLAKTRVGTLLLGTRFEVIGSAQ